MEPSQVYHTGTTKQKKIRLTIDSLDSFKQYASQYCNFDTTLEKKKYKDYSLIERLMQKS